MSLKHDDLKSDFYVGLDGKLESPEQHFYYLAWQQMDYAPRGKTALGLNKYLKSKVEKYGYGSDEFPYKRVLSHDTISVLKKNFEWELRDAHHCYEKSVAMQDKINEYNLYMIESDIEKNVSLDKALTALQNIMVQVVLKLDPGDEFTVNILQKLTNIYNILNRLKMDKTIHINDVGLKVDDWIEVKETIQTHHNELNSNTDYLDDQFQAIDYYFDEYADQ